MLFPHKQPYDNQKGAVLEKVIVALTACTDLVQVRAKIVYRRVSYEVTGTCNLYPGITVAVSDVVADNGALVGENSIAVHVVVSNTVSDNTVIAELDPTIIVFTNIHRLHPAENIVCQSDPGGKVSNSPIPNDNPFSTSQSYNPTILVAPCDSKAFEINRYVKDIHCQAPSSRSRAIVHEVLSKLIGTRHADRLTGADCCGLGGSLGYIPPPRK